MGTASNMAITKAEDLKVLKVLYGPTAHSNLRNV